MGKGLRNFFGGVLVGANTLTFANGAMIAHEYIHKDIMSDSWTSEGDKLFVSFTYATLGSFAALGYSAMDWKAGESPSYVSEGKTPVSYIAERTPDALQIPVGATVGVLGAPGGAIGNFTGSITGYFAPDY